MAVVLGHDAGVAEDAPEPPHYGGAALEHRLAVLVGGRDVLGQQPAQLVELLEVEVAEVGVLQATDGLELDRGVHARSPFSGTGCVRGRGQGSRSRTWRAAPAPTSIPPVPNDLERQRMAAYGVLRDDVDRLLLARASPALALRGRWFLPGGGVQHGEEPREALRREIEEESGLAVTVGPLLDVLSDVRTLPDGTSLHTVRLIYRVASWEGTLRAEVDGTTDAVAWFTRDELRTCRWPATSRRWWTGSCDGPADERHHVVIIGCGFGGLFAAKALRRAPCGSPSSTAPTTTFPAPALPGGHGHPLGGPDRPGHPGRPAQLPPPARRPGRGAAHRRRGPPGPCRRVRPAVTIAYDSLIVAGGAAPSYFGHDEFRTQRVAA